jgi:hypothetical protein
VCLLVLSPIGTICIIADGFNRWYYDVCLLVLSPIGTICIIADGFNRWYYDMCLLVLSPIGTICIIADGFNRWYYDVCLLVLSPIGTICIIADGFNRWYKRHNSCFIIPSKVAIFALYQRLKPSATMQIVPMGLTINKHTSYPNFLHTQFYFTNNKIFVAQWKLNIHLTLAIYLCGDI